MAYTKVKTPIVYYGGKTAILNHILPLIPEHEVYTEVFFGGGTVFFSKKPVENETINDRLDMVINFYKVVKDPDLFLCLKRLIDQTLISKTQHREAINIIKDFNTYGTHIHSPEMVAWAFWFLSNFSHSSKIGGGIKISNDKSVSVCQTLKSRKKQYKTNELAERLENATIENDDALKIIKQRNVKKAFHYVDPPYPNADQGHYAGYTWADYKLLLKFWGYECKGKFLLSSYNSRMLDVAIKMFGWYKTEIRHKLKAPRKSGSEKVEVLVRNYANTCNTIQIWN